MSSLELISLQHEVESLIRGLLDDPDSNVNYFLDYVIILNVTYSGRLCAPQVLNILINALKNGSNRGRGFFVRSSISIGNITDLDVLNDLRRFFIRH